MLLLASVELPCSSRVELQYTEENELYNQWQIPQKELTRGILGAADHVNTQNFCTTVYCVKIGIL